MLLVAAFRILEAVGGFSGRRLYLPFSTGKGDTKMFSSLVEAVVNAQTRNFLTEQNLAQLIKRQELPEEYTAQIFNFFTDVPLPAVLKFLSKYGIDIEDLERYYKARVKSVYSNPKLEGLFA